MILAHPKTKHGHGVQWGNYGRAKEGMYNMTGSHFLCIFQSGEVKIPRLPHKSASIPSTIII